MIWTARQDFNTRVEGDFYPTKCLPTKMLPYYGQHFRRRRSITLFRRLPTDRPCQLAGADAKTIRFTWKRCGASTDFQACEIVRHLTKSFVDACIETWFQTRCIAVQLRRHSSATHPVLKDFSLLVTKSVAVAFEFGI